MIPLLIPPLTGLQVLVTRPALQAEDLCKRVETLGGTALKFPLLDIEPLQVTLPDTRFDVLIFISTNAVVHGQALLDAQPQARIAAVGSATAQAIRALGHTVDVAPAHTASSESLLTHPLLMDPPRSVLIVRGNGGRELLRDTLIARGSHVEVIECYGRVAAQPDVQQLAMLKQQLESDEVDVITITSVEILDVLATLLDAAALQLAYTRTLLAGSARIAGAARAAGWQGECIIAESPEDAALLAALTRWHTRARSELLR
jgi:uroporphyrinogen-III synthase